MSHVVARAPVLPEWYRVVRTGELIPRDSTHFCRGCDGRGKKVERGNGFERTCQWCEGYGRLAGSDPLVWPEPVAPVLEVARPEDGSPREAHTNGHGTGVPRGLRSGCSRAPCCDDASDLFDPHVASGE